MITNYYLSFCRCMTLHLVEPEVGKICLPQLELMALYECLILGNINFSTNNKQLLNKVNEQDILMSLFLFPDI